MLQNSTCLPAVSMLSQSQILKNSGELRRLSDRIHETVRARSNSQEDKAQWKHACAEFHQKFDSLCFPGGAEMFNRVRNNDPVALEAAIRFLAADPYHFRSGYLKECLWRWLPHCRLSISAKNRLERLRCCTWIDVFQESFGACAKPWPG